MTLPEIIDAVNEGTMHPSQASLECLRHLYYLGADDTAIPAFTAASQTFALLHIGDSLVSGGGVSVGDALHPVAR